MSNQRSLIDPSAFRPQGDRKGASGRQKRGPFTDAQGDVVGVILSEAKDLKGSVSDQRISGGPSTSLRAT